MNFIEVHDNIVPKEICEYFIDFFEEQDKLGHTLHGQTGSGYDTTKKDSQDLNPRINDFSDVLTNTNAKAVAAANIFHYIDQSVFIAKKHLYDAGYNFRRPDLIKIR